MRFLVDYKYYHCCTIEWRVSARIINQIGLRESLQAESEIYELLNNNIVQCTVYAYYIYACTMIVLEYL